MICLQEVFSKHLLLSQNIVDIAVVKNYLTNQMPYPLARRMQIPMRHCWRINNNQHILIFNIFGDNAKCSSYVISLSLIPHVLSPPFLHMGKLKGRQIKQLARGCKYIDHVHKDFRVSFQGRWHTKTKQTFNLIYLQHGREFLWICAWHHHHYRFRYVVIKLVQWFKSGMFPQAHVLSTWSTAYGIILKAMQSLRVGRSSRWVVGACLWRLSLPLVPWLFFAPCPHENSCPQALQQHGLNCLVSLTPSESMGWNKSSLYCFCQTFFTAVKINSNNNKKTKQQNQNDNKYPDSVCISLTPNSRNFMKADMFCFTYP